MADGGWRPRHRSARAILRALIRFAFRLLARLSIEGVENVPETGPLLVVANHFHFTDPVAVIRAMPWPLEFIGGFRMPNAPTGVKWLTKLWGTHRVRREGSSRGALRAAERVLEAGGVLGIFPEGGSWATVLRPARPGAAYLATRTGCSILPIGIDGLTDLFPSLLRLRRAPVAIRIGEPFGPFDPVDAGRAGREEIDRIGETIMQRIAELIPAERRGVYSEDEGVRAAAADAAVYPWERGRGSRP
jgi:1-acyl-sn-glycerol-3-phosphate acyltransferase